jgi:SAM-dependent methyltransferase
LRPTRKGLFAFPFVAWRGSGIVFVNKDRRGGFREALIVAMKHCLACDSSFETEGGRCPHCGNAVNSQNGIAVYAPELLCESADRDTEIIEKICVLEEKHFWFRVRRDLLLWVFRKYAPNMRGMLEIGIRSGFFLSRLVKEFPQTSFSGSEVDLGSLEAVFKRLSSVELMQMDACGIPFAHEFDAIGAFDVLEHIEDDELALSQLHRALKSGGIVFLTVPQHAWLWSSLDDYARHFRRYAAAELHSKIRSAGFRLIRSTSFVTFLLPAMLVSRLMLNKFGQERLDVRSEFTINPWLNRIFYCVSRVELALVKMGLNFPVGGSRLIIAQKV